MDGVTKIQDSRLSLPGTKNSSVRVARRENETDQVSLSSEALNVAAQDGISGGKVRGTLGGDQVVFDNTTGSVNWGGVKLQLKGFGNTLKEDIIVEKLQGGGFRLMNYTQNTQLFLKADGTAEKNQFGKPAITEGFAGPTESGALFISNKEYGSRGTRHDDMLINRRADATIMAGSGNDKIFNLNARVKSILAESGNDAVYSVGLKNARVDVSRGNSYVKLLGTAQGATISMGEGQSVLDASGRRLNNTTVNTQKTAEVNIMAAGQLNNSSVTMQGANTVLDVNKVLDSKIQLNGASNAFSANVVTAKEEGATGIVAGDGSRNTFRIGALTKSKLDLTASDDNAVSLNKDAVASSILFGAGQNSLDAAKVTLNKVTVTSLDPEEPEEELDENGNPVPGKPADPSAENGTAIAAKRIVGGERQSASITLLGNGNSVQVSGEVRNASIDLGTGANTFKAGSVRNLNLTAGGEDSTADQQVTIRNGATNLNYIGSAGNDSLSVGGGMVGGSVDLGEGANSLSVIKSMNQTAVNAGQESTTSLSAASYKGKKDADIVLGNGGNTVRFTGRAQQANIVLGEGANTFMAGNGKAQLNDLSISAFGSNTAQKITLNGHVSRLEYEGSDGEDTVQVNGHLTNSTVELGDGANDLNVVRNGRGMELRGVTINASGSNGTTSVHAGAIRNSLNQYTRVNLGDGGSSFIIDGRINAGTSIDLGAGANTFRSQSILGQSGRMVELVAGGGSSTAAQDVFITGRTQHFAYTGSNGTDKLAIRDTMKDSTFNLGYGDREISVPGTQGAKFDYLDGAPPSPENPDIGIDPGIGGGGIGPDPGIGGGIGGGGIGIGPDPGIGGGIGDGGIGIGPDPGIGGAPIGLALVDALPAAEAVDESGGAAVASQAHVKDSSTALDG